MKNLIILCLSLSLSIVLSCKKDNVSSEEENELSNLPDSSGKDAIVITVSTSGVELKAPAGVAADTCGCVIIAEPTENTIKDIAEGGVIKVLAGSGVPGDVDGRGLEASFNNPLGVVKDASGNIYVTDYGNHKIRKITGRGLVSTYAGTGQRGSADGPAAEATFSYPTGIAIDPYRNIYIADGTNYKIRKITPQGVVSTLAGTGSKGSKDGPAATATFGELKGLTVNSRGDIYVAESTQIRKVSTHGEVTTFAGSTTAGMVNAKGTAARFSVIQGIVAGKDDKIYVADFGNSRIRVITPDGLVSNFVGNGEQKTLDGPGWESSFKTPFGIAIDERGDIFVTDPSEAKVRKISLKH